ncbi:hypothetical protein PAESOLCIP111_06620 [Paenibacillus solanacearum]|uniref:Uncharacterized protein n=1 Tax=Paenibacillus solanacearum TaxID=2048548 RepID=A0A916KB18_9BACL|nr:hypothetical protein [Paenibacillus solanacearum]CAG7652758.1 hypothetical protein PAESOLCIP111_06620 [Paenibacillus solanacearum]
MEFQLEVDSHVMEEIEPELNFVIDFLKQMNGSTSSFCTLAYSDYLYLQCAGSKSKMTIEYREPYKDGFKHFVIGIRSFIKISTKVSYSGGEIKVRTNEVFNFKQAEELFKTFYNERRILDKYVLRETTEMFKD